MIEIAICDDSLEDLENTQDILQKVVSDENLNCNIRSFLSAFELLECIAKVDICLLDIEMDEINGIMLGRKIKEKFPDARLIYITSYSEYCMQAVNDAHAFSFLCKPLDKTKMKTQVLDAAWQIPLPVAEKVFCNVTDSGKKEYASVALKADDILYFEYIKRQRKAVIVLKNETYEYDCVFGELEREMRLYGFCTNCRGMMVNMSHIIKIKGFTIYLDNGDELPIAQKRIADFRVKLNEFLQKNS